jgi:hypothetical protein
MIALDARIDRLIARLQREERALQALLGEGRSLEEAERLLAAGPALAPGSLPGVRRSATPRAVAPRSRG